MSLLIVGSCSKVTQNIVLALAKANLYQSISIADLLPVYDHHYRYYRLRKHLNDQKSQTKVTLNKIINIQQLSKQIIQNQNILHVTHDYFTSVTSKTKLMQLTAELSKKKNNVLFAAPIEYDHYGVANPEETFIDAKSKVLQTNPNAGFIRSDVQDTTQLYAYIYKNKNIWGEKLLQTPNSFKPKVVSSTFFAQRVAEQLKNGAKGADLVVRGDRERHFTEVAHNKEIQDYETVHHVNNIRLLVTKYRGPEDKYSTLVINKFG